MPGELLEVIERTDWSLFSDQKLALMGAIGRAMISIGSDSYEAVYLQGLLHWIDALQDALVMDGFVEEGEIFGVDDDNGR